ncbi:hypothetical protein [Halogeometricum limi]|uniref:Uncharacterized protein n=1 Tax=Halogeometricum limi TaxID=555875 RepID=A0A1I6H6A1_9EURY|nr:hypothetical protein [Halogeometricum limi]SFR50036.1 hypothetical protein SAMN04488124_1837 [Halogeometricum limi]
MVTSHGVKSINEYKKWRVRAEHSTEIAKPFLRHDGEFGGKTKMEVHIKLFLEGYNSLQDAHQIFSIPDFDRFLRELVKRISYVEPELVDILKPSKVALGIQHPDPVNEAYKKGDLRFVTQFSPFTFFSAKQPSFDRPTLWWPDAKPWEVLDFEKPETTIVEGTVDPDHSSYNTKLATFIDQAPHLELPDRFKKHLL